MSLEQYAKKFSKLRSDRNAKGRTHHLDGRRINRYFY